MFFGRSAFFLLFFFYLINANEFEISETTLAQINNKFIAYEKRIEDLTKQLTGLKK
jgi:hypothetical protein